MAGVHLSADTSSRLNALFPRGERDEAEALLVEQCGSNLPLCESSDAISLERIRFAALKVSNGDLAALRSAIELAKRDWRDLLVAAGFAHDVHAHRSWSPAGHAAKEGGGASGRSPGGFGP